MCEVKTSKSKDIFKVGTELLSQGKLIKLTVTGDSMYPFLRHNIDSVELCHTDFSSLHRGDIILIVRNSGDYILHRIIKKTKFGVYIVGDGQKEIEGPIYPHQIVALVKSIYRGNIRILCSNIFLRLLSHLWILLLPLRHLIIRTYSFMRSTFKST
jgi:hypothetical protein